MTESNKLKRGRVMENKRFFTKRDLLESTVWNETPSRLKDKMSAKLQGCDNKFW